MGTDPAPEVDSYLRWIGAAGLVFAAGFGGVPATAAVRPDASAAGSVPEGHVPLRLRVWAEPGFQAWRAMRWAAREVQGLEGVLTPPDPWEELPHLFECPSATITATLLPPESRAADGRDWEAYVVREGDPDRIGRATYAPRRCLRWARRLADEIPVLPPFRNVSLRDIGLIVAALRGWRDLTGGNLAFQVTGWVGDESEPPPVTLVHGRDDPVWGAGQVAELIHRVGAYARALGCPVPELRVLRIPRVPGVALQEPGASGTPVLLAADQGEQSWRDPSADVTAHARAGRGIRDADLALFRKVRFGVPPSHPAPHLRPGPPAVEGADGHPLGAAGRHLRWWSAVVPMLPPVWPTGMRAVTGGPAGARSFCPLGHRSRIRYWISEASPRVLRAVADQTALGFRETRPVELTTADPAADPGFAALCVGAVHDAASGPGAYGPGAIVRRPSGGPPPLPGMARRAFRNPPEMVAVALARLALRGARWDIDAPWCGVSLTANGLRLHGTDGEHGMGAEGLDALAGRVRALSRPLVHAPCTVETLAHRGPVVTDPGLRTPLPDSGPDPVLTVRGLHPVFGWYPCSED